MTTLTTYPLDTPQIRTYDLFHPRSAKAPTRRGQRRRRLTLATGREALIVWSDPPSPGECSRAVTRAAGVRRDRHRTDPQFAHLTPAALAERVAGLEALPRHAAGGWWLVGRIIDELADAEFDVYCIPSERRLGMRSIERPATIAPTPPQSRIIFDGERRRWVDRETLEPISELRHGHGQNE